MSVTALDTASMSNPRSPSPCCEAALVEIISSTERPLRDEEFCDHSVEDLSRNDVFLEPTHFDIENYNMENLTPEAAEMNTVEMSNFSFQSNSLNDSMDDILCCTSERVKEIILDMEEYQPYTLPLPPSGSYYNTVFIEEDAYFPEEDSSSQTIDDVVVAIPPTTSEESLAPTGGSFVKVVVGAVISVITLLFTGFAIYRFAA